MPHIPVPDCLRYAYAFRHATAEVQCEMTFALKDTSGGIFADFGATEDQLWTTMEENLLPHLDADVIMHGTLLEDVRTVPYGGLEFDHADTPGTSDTAGADIPTDTCIAIKRASVTLGRSGRGRLYWPIWKANWLSAADQVNDAALANIVDALVAYQTAVEAALSPAELVVISLTNGGAPRVSGVAYQIVSWGTKDNLVDSQRRRLQGRGT